ncbi:putative PfMNL-2 CISD1 family iron-sulfur protein [Besnoitia besnoiti]|uniref:Putative PfMNL-2 CISD1 family iron-sulfur protein n=1 Tax=Besnoitia besnoiti TaxID=94643 RepID=A0A2A9MDH7_BESBE|nr:putative PfMNL-2 CISD1 family iron-sulfur protein [Besnoitia besnoiti]PFH33440.1 putative PfMNL-2 CISD1 family iron-sulfur protein [Besnoitia besnoiti]
MGSQASKGSRPVADVLRKAGDFLNTKNLPAVHTEIVVPPPKKGKKFAVCRCWKSSKFPLCDNIHQKLQKQGINVGPAMLEIRPAPPLESVRAPRVAQSGGSPSSEPVLRDAGAPAADRTGAAALAGGVAASLLAGGAHFAGFI